MKHLKFSLICLLFLILVSCAGVNGPQILTPKQKLITAYSLYNSQYTSYMHDTGYILNPSGEWEKINSPILSNEKKIMLQQKKDILTQMYPQLIIYDRMLNGLIPFSALTEEQVFILMDQLSMFVEN